MGREAFWLLWFAGLCNYGVLMDLDEKYLFFFLVFSCVTYLFLSYAPAVAFLLLSVLWLSCPCYWNAVILFCNIIAMYFILILLGQ